MTTIFLEKDEIKSLTGKATKSAQLRALRFMGIEHKIRPDGSLLVSRSHIEKLLDGNAEPTKNKTFEPNWNLLDVTLPKPRKQRIA